MSFDPNLPIEVLVCYGRKRGIKYPHWMLMLRSQNSNFGTWYHSTGGPTHNEPYKVTIQANKRVDSHGIQSVEYLGTISPRDVNKVTAAAKRVPPQQCQKYVVSLVAELENRHLLPYGHAARLNGQVQISALFRNYEQEHPVPPPSITVGVSSGKTSSTDSSRIEPANGKYGVHKTPAVARSSPSNESQMQQTKRRQDKNSDSCCIVM